MASGLHEGINCSRLTYMDFDFTPLVIIVIVLIIGIGIAIYINKQRRMAAFRAMASRLGLTFDESHNYNLAEQYGFLNRLARGGNRYLFNTLSGYYRGHQVLVSDYHFEIQTSGPKGQPRTQHGYLSLFSLQLPATFPELTVAREGLLSKIAQAFGHDDIDFESAEFSRSFCVRSPDRKFAYDVCNARMMDYLLENRDLSFEIERNALAMVFNSHLVIDKIELNLARLLEIRARLPNFLFERA
ncbi:MAG: hypothetical protein WC299_11025 [Kiritimatiellia bacterium]